LKLDEAIEIFNNNFLTLESITNEETGKKLTLSEWWGMGVPERSGSPPLAYVRKGGRISFNEVAKRVEFIDEVKEILTLIWQHDHKPRILMLTSSLKELAEIAPSLKVVSMGGYGVKEVK